MLVIWAVETALRRLGTSQPWIYGWAASCVLLSSSITFLCLRDGWGLAWSVGLALLIGPTAYPVLRNLMVAAGTAPPYRVYTQHNEDPPLDAPGYQATSFGAASAPIRPERPSAPAPPEPIPRVFRWEDATVPEFRRAAVVTVVLMLMIVAGITSIMRRSLPAPAGDVAAALAQDGYQAVRVYPAENEGRCADGRAKPFRWTAPGVEGEACRSNSGRVSYWVVRTWPRDGGR